jgi:hypothetical protein
MWVKLCIATCVLSSEHDAGLRDPREFDWHRFDAQFHSLRCSSDSARNQPSCAPRAVVPPTPPDDFGLGPIEIIFLGGRCWGQPVKYGKTEAGRFTPGLQPRAITSRLTTPSLPE